MNLKPFIAAAALMVAGAAHGSVLFSLPYDPAQLAGTNSQNFTDFPGVYRNGYEPFALAAGATLTRVDFAGVFDPSQPSVSSFTVGIFADASGLPGALVATQTLLGDGRPKPLGGETQGSLESFSYSLRYGPNALTSGNYWFSVAANAPSTLSWYWGDNLTGPELGLTNTGAGFKATNVDYALTLHGVSAVPEPSTWIAMILGLGAAGTVLRRRRRLVAVSGDVVPTPERIGQGLSVGHEL